jgi:hypothetical protein
MATNLIIFQTYFINITLLNMLKMPLLLVTSVLFYHLGNSQGNIDEKNISLILDSLNSTAKNVQFEKYFSLFDKNAVFMGTDAKERWGKNEFMIWAKPYFENGKTWKFETIDRHIYFSSDNNIAWFDERLKTQMKLCRGSGVLIKVNNEWKIVQYNLSMSIPNEINKNVTMLKGTLEDSILEK